MSRGASFRDLVARVSRSPLAAVAVVGRREAWRNPRRSAVTAAICGVAVVLTVVAHAVAVGGEEERLTREARRLTGDLQVTGRGFDSAQPLATAFAEDVVAWASLQREIRGIESFSMRLSASALVSSSSASIGATVIGIEPQRDAQVATLSREIEKGERLADGDRRAVVIGRTLAGHLGADVGDTLDILANNRNRLTAGRFRIKGMLGKIDDEVDREVALIPLYDVQELFRMPGMITSVNFRLHDPRSASQAAAYLRIRTDPNDLQTSSIRDSRRGSGHLSWSYAMAYRMVFALAVMLVGFGVAINTTAGMQERRKELTVMHLIGVRRRDIVAAAFVREFAILSAAFLAMALLSLIIINILYHVPISLPTAFDVVFASSSGGGVRELRLDRSPANLFPVMWLVLIAVISAAYPIISGISSSQHLRSGEMSR